MAEILSPGVYVEEVATAAQVTAGVSTSNMGILGYAPQGPANEAVLVTSYEQYSRVFGGLVTQSYMPLSMVAFFANGGRRAYVVRVPPSDAIAADAKIQSDIVNELVFTGDGTLATIEGELSSGPTPIVPGSATVEWRSAGTPLVGQNTRNAEDSANLSLVVGQASYAGRIATAASLPTYDPRMDSVVRGTATFKFTVAAVGALSVAIPVGTASISQGSDGGATAGVFVTLDHRSGRFSIYTYGSYVPAAGDTGAITVDFTPATDTRTAQDARGAVVVVSGADLADSNSFTLNDGVNPAVTFEYDNNGAFSGTPIPFTVADTVEQVRDATVTAINAFSPLLLKAVAVAGSTSKIRLVPNSSTAPGEVVLTESVTAAGFSVAPTVASSTGLWVGDTSAAGSMTYDTGNFSIPVTGYIPHNKALCYASSTENTWDLNPISVGAWGNGLRVQVSGSPNYFTAETGTYTRFDVVVAQYSSTSDSYSVLEAYEELVFDDTSSPVYFADVINELSDYITVGTPAGNRAPPTLSGVPYTQVLAGGNGLADNKSISVTLAAASSTFSVQPRTVVITYTNVAGATKTITDDGNGNLVGSVLSSAVNTIDYESGIVTFTTSDLIKGATLVTASYSRAPTEQAHTEDFGSLTKLYRRGTEGTFSGAYWGRNQFTEISALAADYKGLYAFNKVDEILQVVVPDFVNDVNVARDLLTYADIRSQQPAGGDRFIILSAPSGRSAQQAVDWFRYTLGQYSNYAALYWPWVRVSDPLLNGRPKLMPALAHIAGVYARTDNNRNVGKAPGGTVDGALVYLNGLETNPTLADRDIVYPNKINPLISSPQTGLAVWGVRTISNVPDWKYINARRLFMYLEKSVFGSTWWAVFENNGPALWSRLTTQISGFLNNLFLQGYFAGSSASQAYFVVCDSSNNTPQTVEAGQVVIDIGVAPNKPAEFIRLRFQQKSLNS